MNKNFQIIVALVSFYVLNSCRISKSIHHKPILTGYNNQIPEVIKHNDSLFSSGKNYLIKNKSIISNKHGLYQTSKSRSLDINDKADLIIAKKIL